MQKRLELERVLDHATWQTLHAISEMATNAQTPAYIVGGGVRDFLLGAALTDLDIVIVGDAVALAERIAARYGGNVRSHARFGTANWRPDDERPDVDFITARREWYPAAAALPEVAPGNIYDDLRRRDFTINTLAIRLDGSHQGELLDVFHALADLKQRTVRVLHERSFIDDPTRIFRAVRYEQRLGFDIEPVTLSLLHTGVGGIQHLTPDRVRHELEHMLAEANPAVMLQRLDRLGALAALHPALRWSTRAAADFNALAKWRRQPPWPPAADWEPIYWLLWLGSLSFPTQQAIAQRLSLTRRLQQSLANYYELQHVLPTCTPSARASLIEQALRPYLGDIAALTAARIRYRDTHIAGWLDSLILEWQHVTSEIGGHELLQRGIPPGPEYRHILDLLRAAHIDGTIQSLDDEWRLVEQALEKVAISEQMT